MCICMCIYNIYIKCIKVLYHEYKFLDECLLIQRGSIKCGSSAALLEIKRNQIHAESGPGTST